MRTFFISLLLTTVLGSVTSTEANPSPAFPDTIRVLTYNLHGLLDDGSPPEWDPARAHWLVDAVAELDPDIIGFQEVLQSLDSDGSDNQILALVDSLRRRTGDDWDARIAMSHVSWERFEEGLAILTKHPISESEEWALTSRDVFQRKLLKAAIQTPVGPVAFFTTHLAYREEADSVRRAQMEEIKKHVWTRNPRSMPAIVVGDFNAEPDRPSIQLATRTDSYGRFIDAFDLLHPDAPGPTFPARDPARRIDYVFVNDATVLIPIRADVVLNEKSGERLLSDHLGVLVEFVIQPTAGKPR